MTRKRIDATDRRRMQVVCTTAQEDAIGRAAEAVGARDRGTFVLGHGLKAAGAAHLPMAPAVLGGEVSDKLRAEAKRQGVSIDDTVEILLAGSTPAARKSRRSR